DARRRGLSRAAMGAAVRAGAARGITDLWLQVVAENRGALALYDALGFVPASRYEYWARTRQPSDATRSARNPA
ncbi:GNAT family N-acetyltransferase, partial [Clavibacter nebraskensis]